MRKAATALICALTICLPVEGYAQEPAAPPAGLPVTPPPAAASDGAGAGLAKQLANPIASLISVPFQQNVDFGIGPDDDGVRATMNIQPVVPISIGPSTNLISRTILPVTYQNADVAGDSEFGLGDVVQSLFLSPKRPTSGGLIWGAGPVVLVPTATQSALGAEKWGAGPTIVVLKQNGGFTYGALANHIWSFAGKNSRSDISQTFLQPFVNHTWPSTIGVSLSAESLYDWKTERWTIPLNLAVSRIVRLGKQPASVQAGVRYYAERPDGGPDWGVRLGLTLLFPKR